MEQFFPFVQALANEITPTCESCVYRKGAQCHYDPVPVVLPFAEHFCGQWVGRAQEKVIQ